MREVVRHRFSKDQVRLGAGASAMVALLASCAFNGEDLGIHVGGSYNRRNVDPTDFTVAMMSDPQFAWECKEEACKEAAKSARLHAPVGSPSRLALAGCSGDDHKAKQARVSNEWHRDSLVGLAEDVGDNFAGIVVNGDVTAFGWAGEWSEIKRIYREGVLADYPVYTGLGNHDYANNVDDCGWYAVSPLAQADRARNHCAYRSVWHLKTVVSKLEEGGHEIDFDAELDNNPTNATPWRNVSGSLAYSWDIGRVHFVQLHNYPAYETRFTYGYRGGVHSFQVDIQPSFDWLEANLQGLAADRVIVVNLHDWDDHMTAEHRTTLAGVLAPYKDRVVGIFAGHRHHEIGKTGSLAVDGHDVPVFHCGSADYNKYLRVDFQDDRAANAITMKVCEVSSVHGNFAAPAADCSEHRTAL